MLFSLDGATDVVDHHASLVTPLLKLRLATKGGDHGDPVNVIRSHAVVVLSPPLGTHGDIIILLMQ
jgi:hypothetical protein